MRHFCTYFDNRYLTRGLALHQSLRQYCPQSTLWVLCLDSAAYDILTELALDGLRPIAHEEFLRDDSQLKSARNDRGLIEYYFTCTPSLVLFILARQPALEMVTYLDADLYFFSSPEPLFEEMGTCSIAITPHRFSPTLRDLERYGIYNVGWLSFRRDPVAIECLQWWRARCLEWCHDHVEDGKFADQKYLDQWPALFGSVAVLAHPGANLAAWNLTGVKLGRADETVTVNGRPLIFYHFHQLKRINPAMYEMKLMDYGVKPCRILRRHILSGYLRVLSALEWQMRDRLPVISAEANLRHESRHPDKSAGSNGVKPHRLFGRWKRFFGLLKGLLTGKYFLCLRRQ
jgi:hypothetical protein